MSDEPIAWAYTLKSDDLLISLTSQRWNRIGPDIVEQALYAHPPAAQDAATFPELSDEECRAVDAALKRHYGVNFVSSASIHMVVRDAMKGAARPGELQPSESPRMPAPSKVGETISRTFNLGDGAIVTAQGSVNARSVNAPKSDQDYMLMLRKRIAQLEEENAELRSEAASWRDGR